MEPPAVKSPLNYPAKCFSYSPAITLTSRRQMLLRRRKLNYVRTASLALKFPPVIKECENCEVIDARVRKRKEWIHFVGVGGCGLSALAMLAVKQGYVVSGSDIMWNNAMGALREAGARVYIGHSELNLRKHNDSMPDALVVSSAICGDNVEILYAESVGIPVYKRGAWLGRITESYNLIAVGGSHGKSTTSSMLAYVLHAMGNDLTAVIGAWVPQLAERNIICGTGGNFVLEADEYDCCFLGVTPQIAVVTNIDWEHVDIFQDVEAVKTIFQKFIGQIKVGGHLILCGDSLGACSLVNKMGSDSGASSVLRNDAFQISTYGISSCNDWHPLSISPNSCGGTDYKLIPVQHNIQEFGAPVYELPAYYAGTPTRRKFQHNILEIRTLVYELQAYYTGPFHKGHHIADISLQIPGVHNVLNSLAVIATIHALFADQKKFLSSMASLQLHLQKFEGVSRRFEKIGIVRGCHIYDDYAHHPTEIQAVLQAARQRFPFQELIVVFQPHTYSRLAALKDDFATAFTNANRVMITEIYAARERNLWKISGSDLAMSVVGPPSEFIPSLIQVLEMLVDQISKDPDHETVILTLGAGDITAVGHKLLLDLQQRLL